MDKIPIDEIEISFDETYHIYKGKPLYNKRFKKVMSFHHPGIAAVIDENGMAYHINIRGEAIYSQRYLKTYGFYEGISTVVDESGSYFHINTEGNPIHNRKFAWAGNFQEGRCVVRDFDGYYFHITREGKDAYEDRYAYVGDYKYGIAVVYDFDGYATHIDKNGKPIHNKKYLELGVFHKGYAIARDEIGYFHIDKKGNPLYEKRFAWVENFYNDYALVKTFGGETVIVDEKGNTIKKVVDYNSNHVLEFNRKKLMGMLVGYWHTQILYAIVKLGLLEIIGEGCPYEKLKNDVSLPEKTLNLIIKYLSVNNLIELRGDDYYSLTPQGKLLTDLGGDKKLKYAALMWAEEHYTSFSHLLYSLKTGKPVFPKIYGKTFFEYLADYPEKCEVYQNAMKEYSVDYDEIIKNLNIPDYVHSIMDLGGGHGNLLDKVLETYPHLSVGYLADLPHTLKTVKNDILKHDKIKIAKIDFFEDIPLKVDAIILARVLHDWDDEYCLKILHNIKNTLTDNGIVYVIEMIVPENCNYDCGYSLNFNLLAMVGGKERTLTEFRNLFSKEGFKIDRVVETSGCKPSLMVLKKIE